MGMYFWRIQDFSGNFFPSQNFGYALHTLFEFFHETHDAEMMRENKLGSRQISLERGRDIDFGHLCFDEWHFDVLPRTSLLSPWRFLLVCIGVIRL